MSALIDLTGQRFGRLTVLHRDANRIWQNGAISVRWVCRCDCGATVTVLANSLRKGATKSCGCAHEELCSQHHPNRKHGGSFQKSGSGERLYRVWLGMRERCSNPKHNRYKDYGGRGIYVCEDWEDYAVFREWAMLSGYDPNAARGQCTIDRIDVEGPYAPWNCRWVDMKVQAQNKQRKF